jgi:ABC-type transporter Mla subunit MlaD
MDTTAQGAVAGRSGDFDEARAEGERAVEHGTNAASKAADAAKGMATDQANSFKSAIDDKKDQANQALHSFKSVVEDQKTAGAGAVGDFARAAKSAADGFEERAPDLANAVRSVADRVEGVSNSVRDTSLDDLFTSVTEFAGRKPVTFFGVGILAGLVISRLLSSPSR